MSYGLYLSPTINYRTLTSNAPNNLVKEIRDKEEIAGLSYRAGGTFNYRISDKMALQSGLILSNRVFKTAKQALVWSESNASNPTEAYISQQYFYLDIPLKLKYTFLTQKRLEVFVSGGINTALFFLYNNKNHVNVSGNWEVSTNQSSNLSSINFLAEIESGIEYKFNSKLKFRTALFFIHGITPTNANLKTKEFLYSGGLNFGFVFTPYK